MDQFARRTAGLANSLHNRLDRFTKGRVGGRVDGMPVLLIAVAGRKYGVAYTVPCVYREDRDTWIVSGSGAGMPQEPQWFRNLRANERATAEIGAVRTPVSVEVPDGEQ